MLRERASLDGTWQFWPDPAGRLGAEIHDQHPPSLTDRDALLGAFRRAAVPVPWQSQFDDLRLASGWAWYERSFAVPESWRGLAVRLLFGAVDYHCTVWVNARRAGSHEGGYLPFDLDVTALLRFGDINVVTVAVFDPGPDDDGGPFSFAEVPHGKQSWYGPTGGLWQSVHLEATAPGFVRGAHVVGRLEDGTAEVSARLGSPAAGGEELVYRVISPDGHDVFRHRGPILERGATEQRAEVVVPRPEPWSLEAPRLHTLVVELHDGSGRVSDAWQDTFGFRTVGVRDGHIAINGRPVYILGALDQDYYLGSICTPPSDDLLRAQALRAKELGLNLLRCHIKVPDPRYLYWADRLGLLVWSELPSWGVPTEESKRRARITLEGIVARDFNHPSIVIWTVINEGWGLDLPGSEDDRRWQAETFDRLRDMDPTRLIVDNSACPPNFHVKSDLNDYHFYRALPDQLDEWSALLEGWVRHPGSTWSPFGDAVTTGMEPQLVSEFGSWGLPDVNDLVDEDGRDPWWFDTGDDRNDVDGGEGVRGQQAGGIVRPRGVRERWRRWGLEDVFGSWRAFVRASQDHQFDGMKLAIEDMRRREQISGYVVTELTDCHWECNGLLDMARNPKSYHHRFPTINAPDVVAGLPSRFRYRSGETVSLQVTVSHCSPRPLRPCSVVWSAPQLGLSGRLTGVSVGAPAVVNAGEVRFAVPALSAPARISVELSLMDRLDRQVNRNTVDLLLFPRQRRRRRPGDVAVVARWDEALADRLENGGRAVIVAGGSDALPPAAAPHVVAREGTRWKGDWAQGMGWLSRELRDGLPLLARVDSVWAGMTPAHVILGYPPQRRDDVLAGYYIGWIHSMVATIAAFRHGDGAALVCTFPIGRGVDDPLASALLERLVAIASDSRLRPATRLDP